MRPPETGALAYELALRFRTLARALDRLDRLEGERTFSGWLTRLSQDQEVLAQLSTTLALQTLHAATEEALYQLLCSLKSEDAVPLTQVCQETGLDRATLYLRLGRLAHVGLVTLELDAEAVRSTALGRALAHWLSALIEETRTQITEWLELVGSTAS